MLSQDDHQQELDHRLANAETPPAVSNVELASSFIATMIGEQVTYFIIFAYIKHNNNDFSFSWTWSNITFNFFKFLVNRKYHVIVFLAQWHMAL